MKKLIIVLGIMVTSCNNNYVKEKDPQIVLSINYAKDDKEWSPTDCKYIARTQDFDLATDSLYSIGDTLKIGKKN